MLRRIFIGKPISLKAHHTQTVSKKEALALLSSDALSSVAYGPEQIIIVLTLAGVLTLSYSLIVGLLIVLLLTLLVVAYRDVITLFPEGGGAYKMTQRYMHKQAALSTAALLLVDYILTIAVSVSAGVDALIATIPILHSWYIEIACGFVILLLLLNLRGVSETAKVLMLPIYAFIVSLLILYIVASLHWFDPINNTIVSNSTMESFAWLLLLKAFAVGCSALTGVEAISNAVPNFKTPAANNAKTTLLILGALLIVLFSGVLIFSTHFHITPAENTTVLSLLTEAIVGRNAFFYLLQSFTICILLLAANTSFVAFPSLLANLARDGYAPRIFLNKGYRLRLLK
ncbi:MAG: APC family permease [Lysinibacillus sp.]